MDTTTLLLGLLGLIVIGLLQAIARRLSTVIEQQRLLLRHLGALDAAASAEVRSLAQDPGRRIDAIRLYRQQSGADLKAAVDVIDQLTGRG